MPASLSNNGFLDLEISGTVQRVRAAHAEIFAFCERLNELAHRSLFSAKVDRHNIRELVLSTLIHKAMTAYQAVVIVAERGLPSEARVLLRTLLEVTFRAGAIAKNPDAARQFVNEDVIRRSKLIRKFKSLSPHLQASADSAELDRVLQTLVARIAAERIVERPTLWYAQQAGMEDFYRSAYTLLSEAVHVSIGQLESSLTLDAEGRLLGLTYGPSDEDIEMNLLTGAEALIFALRATYSVVDVQTSDEIHRIHDELNALHVRYSGAT
jgi:hypothetical protein